MKIAIFALSADPIHNGHLDIIKRSQPFCDRLVVAKGINSSKTPFIPWNDSIDLIKSSLIENKLDNFAEVIPFQILLVNFAKEQNANILIRGVRNSKDFEYEMHLASINKYLAPEIETIFIPTDPALAHVSSSVVRELLSFKENIDSMVPRCVSQYLKK